MKNEEKLNNIYFKCRENKNSHVYLVETNSVYSALEDIKKLIVKINEDNSENDIKKLIETDSLPTFTVIKPETLEIKTDVIDELIKKLQCIPVITSKNYFVVCEAEKLNQKSGNSMLKIIEEPDCDILGFFICNNANNVMQTIQSRSQYISLSYELNNNFNSDVREDALKLLDILHIEKNIVDNKYFTDKYKSVLEFDNLIDCLIVEIKNYINTSDNFDIIKKENNLLKMVTDTKSNINKNCNVNLMLDKLIIEVGRL
jgi:DNA polymerase III delta prime subunit